MKPGATLAVIDNQEDGFDAILDLLPTVRDSVISPNSKRAYYRSLLDFVRWNAGAELGRSRVLEYRQHLIDGGSASSTINLALSAIRKLAEEAECRGYIDERTMRQIRSIESVSSRGVRFGNWLTEDKALELLMLPDQNTPAGLRDFLLLGMLMGCGMRREEAAVVLCTQVVERDGRMVVMDYEGKGRKLRTSVLPRWMEAPVRRWIKAIGREGYLLRPVYRGGAVGETKLSGEGVRLIVHRYTKMIGVEAAPHDLRRTFALQALEGGADIEAVRQALGHASLATTTRYVSSSDALRNPACDFVLGGK